MGLMRESFIFYRSFYESIKDLDSELQVEILHAVSEYALYGKSVEMSPICKALFTAFVPSIATAKNRYDACVENGKKGAEYGHLGGRPKTPKGTPEETPDNTGTERTKTPDKTPKHTSGKTLNETPDKTPEETGYKPLTVSVTDTVTDTVSVAVSARGRARGLHGNVILDDYAYEQLLQEMGEAALKDYVNRLDGYLVKNPKFRGDHGSTILRWYNEDEAKRRAEEEKAKALEPRKNYSAEELNAIFFAIKPEDM